MRKIEYELSDKQEEKLKEWEEEVRQRVIERQRKSMSPKDFEFYTLGGKHAYSGAIGGAFSWIITPTSIGTAITAKFWGEELDLTDYDKW